MINHLNFCLTDTNLEFKISNTVLYNTLRSKQMEHSLDTCTFAEDKAEVVEKLQLTYLEVTACWLFEILGGYSDIAVQNNRSLNSTSTEWYSRHHAPKQKTKSNYRSLKQYNSMNQVTLVLGITSTGRFIRLYW